MKELLENSLDAAATHVKITLKEGGIKSLHIQDNGHGIRKNDLPLLCERFATSKLRKFEDLTNMTTFGFRGEALASISYVSAAVHVVSKRADDICAYRADFCAGTLSSEPRACAGTNGTSIMAQDLFFNTSQRKRALRSASEEYNRSLDVVTKYALHYGPLGVSFSCKKAEHVSMDLQTLADARTTIPDMIRTIYGSHLARDLLHLSTFSDAKLGFKAEGWFSNANWSSRRITFICFINHRLVECPSLKRALESVYAQVLPKGQSPWIYVALEIEPNRIDVNVHPTKQEVHFLDEEDIIELITARVQDILADQSSCRVYSTRNAPLGQVVSENQVQVLRSRGHDPRHLVRVDNSDQRLDGMVQIPSTILRTPSSDKILQNECKLSSVRELRQECLASHHVRLTKILQNHSFVGIVDLQKGLSLIQHNTQLYLVKHGLLIEDFGYQLALRQFGSLATVRLDPAPSLSELIGLGYDREPADEQKAALGLSREQVIERVARKVRSHAEMLRDYFGLCIDLQNNTVCEIPTLLPQHGSFGLSLERLPSLFFRLGPQVDWDDEKGCFYTMCRELALAHVPPSWGTCTNDSRPDMDEKEAWIIQHVWFAQMHGSRGRCVVTSSLPEDVITQVASLPDLCKYINPLCDTDSK